MNLVMYPNDVLSTPCQPVTIFDESLSQTITEMTEVLIKHNGLGLAANQCGLNLALFLIKDNKGQIHEMINPKIVDFNGEVVLKEGCLSTPGIFLSIQRPESVLVEYQDKTGEKKRIIAEGWEARTILHEYDHLNGIDFLMKVNRYERKKAISQLKKKK